MLTMAIVCFFGSWYRYKTIYNPFSIMNILWGIVLLLLCIGNRFVDTPNNEALMCITVGLFAFNITMLIPQYCFKLGNSNLAIPGAYSEYTFNLRIATILSVVVFAFSLIFAETAIKAVMSGTSFAVIRKDYYSYGDRSSVLLSYFRSYCLIPARYVVVVAAIYSFFKKISNTIVLKICAISILILQTITEGGRGVLVTALYMFIGGYFLFSSEKKLTTWQKIRFVVLLIVILWVIVFLTNDRATSNMINMTGWERIQYTFYLYFAGSVSYLEAVIKNTPFIVGSTHGVNFIAGWITPFFVLLTGLGVIRYPEFLQTIGKYACIELSIGRIHYNALPTAFGYFYFDGGYVLTFVFSVIFAYVCRSVYINAKNGNLLHQMFYIMLFVQLCNFSTRWKFYGVDFCLAFVYMRMIVTKQLWIEK